MGRPMFASYEAQARYEAKEFGLTGDLVRVMELVGQIADNETYNGPIDVKIQLIALILERSQEKKPAAAALEVAP